IDVAEINVDSAIATIYTFIEEHNIVTLNVAGPRASQAEFAYQFSYEVISRLINKVRKLD
ncbi:MAG: putative molybdenum carrier protein, partial [Pseudomonadota bacterium]